MKNTTKQITNRKTSIDFLPENYEKLCKFCKEQKISKSDVINALLSNCELNNIKIVKEVKYKILSDITINVKDGDNEYIPNDSEHNINEVFDYYDNHFKH